MSLVYSFTFLDKWHNVCPRQAYEIYVAKTIPYTDSPATEQGKKDHAALERRVRTGDALPDHLAKAEPIAASLGRQGLKKFCEFRMGATAEWEAADYWPPKDPYSKAPWIRCATDVFAYTPGSGAGIIIDWKTGKKRDNWLQHAVNASIVFAHTPRLENVKAFNVYTSDGSLGEVYNFDRGTILATRQNITRLTQEVEQSLAAREWPERQGPLCGYCPVTACRFNRNKEVR